MLNFTRRFTPQCAKFCFLKGGFPKCRVHPVLPAVLLLAGWCHIAAPVSQAADPLPSWNDGPARRAILDFVARTTKSGENDFVPVDERIACHDIWLRDLWH